MPAQVAPEGPTGFVAPWGDWYPSEAEAWAEGILSGGVSGDLTRAEQAERYDAMCAWRDTA